MPPLLNVKVSLLLYFMSKWAETTWQLEVYHNFQDFHGNYHILEGMVGCRGKLSPVCILKITNPVWPMKWFDCYRNKHNILYFTSTNVFWIYISTS